MIQFNLLPDIKLAYIRAQRTRRLIIGIAGLTTIFSVVLLLTLLSIDGLQRKHLADLNRDITSGTQKLASQPNVNAILTLQNQLGSLTQLHDGKPAASRLFNYLNEITPAKVSLTNLQVDFTQQAITLTGAADSLSSVTQYVNTLKLTTYNTGADSDTLPAFSNIVLSSFGLNGNSIDASQAANYTINLNYDPTIFDITKTIGQDNSLSVPSVTTRAQLPNATDLFKAKTEAK
jgi:Tfp pilus assembly protein PilN